VFEHRPRVRFFEVDQQAVVYHMWYLAYFEDARNELLLARGAGLHDLQADGLDLQIVKMEADWSGPVRWGDPLRVEVGPVSLGRSSLAVDYRALVGDAAPVSARATYVLVDRESKHATPWPDELRARLEAGDD
jgi:acyl-CoA thioester hydrolase